MSRRKQGRKQDKLICICSPDRDVWLITSTDSRIGDSDYISEARIEWIKAWLAADPLDDKTWPTPYDLPVPRVWPLPDPLSYLMNVGEAGQPCGIP